MSFRLVAKSVTLDEMTLNGVMAVFALFQRLR